MDDRIPSFAKIEADLLCCLWRQTSATTRENLQTMKYSSLGSSRLIITPVRHVQFCEHSADDVFIVIDNIREALSHMLESGRKLAQRGVWSS